MADMPQNAVPKDPVEYIGPDIEWDRAAKLAEQANRELMELEAAQESALKEWEIRREELIAMLEAAQHTMSRLSSWSSGDAPSPPALDVYVPYSPTTRHV